MSDNTLRAEFLLIAQSLQKLEAEQLYQFQMLDLLLQNKNKDSLLQLLKEVTKTPEELLKLLQQQEKMTMQSIQNYNQIMQMIRLRTLDQYC